MKVHTRMLLKEVANELGFVGREVVEDDMNLLPSTMIPLLRERQRRRGWYGGPRFFRARRRSGCPARYTEKAFRAGSTRSRAAPLAPAKAAERVHAVQGLNGGFLIDAEHSEVLQRPQIRADNVGRL